MIAKKNKPDAEPGLLGNDGQRGASADLEYKLIFKAQAFIYSKTAWFECSQARTTKRSNHAGDFPGDAAPLSGESLFFGA